MPDLDLATDAGPIRTFSLLHAARPLLVNLGERGGLDIGPWAERVQLVNAREALTAWFGPAAYRPTR